MDGRYSVFHSEDCEILTVWTYAESLGRGQRRLLALTCFHVEEYQWFITEDLGHFPNDPSYACHSSS